MTHSQRASSVESSLRNGLTVTGPSLSPDVRSSMCWLRPSAKLTASWSAPKCQKPRDERSRGMSASWMRSPSARSSISKPFG